MPSDESLPVEDHVGIAAFERNGIAVVRGLVADERLPALRKVFDDAGPLRRDGLVFSPIAALARSAPLRALAGAMLGDRARCVRAILFDKSAESNWFVGWHRDETVAVRERLDVAGFSAWSEKGGMSCARAPRHVLRSMVSIRVDLDGSHTDNGALLVSPGSHLREDDEVLAQRSAGAPPGGAVVMAPLLLHASRRSVRAVSRRIVHLEFASRELPGGLTWAAWI